MGQKSFQYRQFTVEEEHVTAYVQHREEQKAYALIRAREKQQKRNAILKAKIFRRLLPEKTTRKW